MSALSTRRGTAVLAATGALLFAALLVAPQAHAMTIYACVKKKSGTARVFTKKPKCKKGETKLSWNTEGLPGKNGTNGTNGTNGVNGKEGAPGQPQSAVAFNASAEAPLLENRTAALFSLAGVSVKLNCVNVLFVNVAELEASGPASTNAESGMVDSRANNKEATENFQQLVYNVPVTTNTVFGALITNVKGELFNVGHVNAAITTPSAVILIDAFIEVSSGAKACVARGTAFSIPT